MKSNVSNTDKSKQQQTNLSSKKPATLRVVQSPSTDLLIVSTNYAYVNQEILDYMGDSKFMELGKFVFRVASHEKMKFGEIGVNKIQRESARLSLGTEVNFVPYVYPSTIGYCLSSIKVEVSFVNPKGIGDVVSIDGKDFAEHLKRSYPGQIFRLDQKFVVSYFDQTLKLRVMSMEGTQAEEVMKNYNSNDSSATTGTLKSSTIDSKESTLKISGFDDLHAVMQEGLTVTTTQYVLFKEKDTMIKFTNYSAETTTTTIFKEGFNFEQLGIGGLDNEFSSIFRRAFASRVFPQEIIEKLGIKHVKGIMLYGPPGTGKTLIARQIGKVLNTKEPKVVNGPEVLNKYVGQSEENVRALFKEAEEEYQSRGDQSDLHLIIFDEIDAICKQRGSSRSGTGVNDSVVNQLLSKIDGIKSLNNVLVIGMTNRLDMLDEALLRPGRFEVQMEIGLPDLKGRVQILRIHTKKMKANKFLDDDVDLEYLATKTKNFSGAEIEGLVKSASSFALIRQVDVNNLSKIDASQVKLSMVDFESALQEVKPSFGVSQEELENFMGMTLIDYGPAYEKLLSTCSTFVNQVKSSAKTPLLSFLLEGEAGCGSTSFAANLALKSNYPYVKVISSERMVGYDERMKCDYISKVFSDAYKSPLSVIVLDNIERLIEYVGIGPRFSNAILQTILVVVKKVPPKNRRLLVIGTTNSKDVLKDMDLVSSFNSTVHVPYLTTVKEMKSVLLQTGAFNDDEELQKTLAIMPSKIGIKNMLLTVEMAKSRVEKSIESKDSGTGNDQKVSADEFERSLHDIVGDNL